MELPQEIEVWYIIPALRRELAASLKKKGLPQKEIASLLGITESAVSQYLRNKRGMETIFPKKISEAIAFSAEKIAKKGNATDELMQLTQLVKAEKVLCTIHKQHSTVPEGCNVCLERD